jgi:hypothetical protein
MIHMTSRAELSSVVDDENRWLVDDGEGGCSVTGIVMGG